MKTNIMIIGVIMISILILSGCSKPHLEGKVMMDFNEKYEGYFNLKLESNSLDNIEWRIFELPKNNPLTLGFIVKFYSGKDTIYFAKAKVCNQGDQFGRVEIKCDIAKFRIIREGNKAHFIREECFDCKKELSIVKSIWMSSDLSNTRVAVEEE